MKPTAELKHNTMQTISENEVLSFLSIELPQLDIEVISLSDRVTVYSIISCFADFTKYMIHIDNLKQVKHCFNVAEKLWMSENNSIKNAIENGYLFSLSSILDLNNKIKELLNAPLKNEYNRQVLGSGI